MNFETSKINLKSGVHQFQLKPVVRQLKLELFVLAINFKHINENKIFHIPYSMANK